MTALNDFSLRILAMREVLATDSQGFPRGWRYFILFRQAIFVLQQSLGVDHVTPSVS